MICDRRNGRGGGNKGGGLQKSHSPLLTFTKRSFVMSSLNSFLWGKTQEGHWLSFYSIWKTPFHHPSALLSERHVLRINGSTAAGPCCRVGQQQLNFGSISAVSDVFLSPTRPRPSLPSTTPSPYPPVLKLSSSNLLATFVLSPCQSLQLSANTIYVD